jgi:hypothetical protein
MTVAYNPKELCFSCSTCTGPAQILEDIIKARTSLFSCLAHGFHLLDCKMAVLTARHHIYIPEKKKKKKE